MCQFCQAITRNTMEETEYEQLALSLAGLFLSHFKQDEVPGTVANIIAEFKLEVSPEHGRTLFAAGVETASINNAHLIGAALVEKTVVMREMHLKLAALRKLYATTPTILDHVAPLADLAALHARHEVDDGLALIAKMLEQSGIRDALLRGTDKMEDMIDEEFAMIGERSRTSTHPQAAVKTLALGLMAKRRHGEITDVTVGKVVVESALKLFNNAKELAQQYLRGDNGQFIDLVHHTLSH